MELVAEQRSSRMRVLTSKSLRVSATVLAKVLEKSQRVGTWALEVPECEHLDAVVSAKSRSVSTWALEISAKSGRSFRVWALRRG